MSEPSPPASPAAGDSRLSLQAPLYAERSEERAAESGRDVARLVDRHALLMAMMSQLTAGVILTGYALALGASRILIGVIAALPFCAKLAQLFLSWHIERRGHWKEATLRWAGAGRCALLLGAAIPFITTSPPLGAVMLLGVVAVASLGGAVYEMAFLTWMAELVPESQRGAFFGARARIAGITSLGVSVIAGFVIDRWHSVRPGSITPFAVLFAIGAGAGLLGLAYLRRVPAPRRHESRVGALDLREALTRPARDANFRRLCTFAAVWSFAGSIVSPFYTVYMLEQLQLPFLHVTLFAATTSALISVVQLYWGRLGDHFGSKTTLRAGTYLIALVPAIWLLASPQRLWPLVVIALLSGFAWGAYHLSLGNLILKLAPPGARPSYIATFGAAQGSAETVAPIIGGLVLDSLQAMGYAPHSALRVLIVTSLILFLLATPLLGAVHEPGGVTVGRMIRVMGRFRAMGVGMPTAIILDHIFTHLARIADFVAREDGPPPTPAPSAPPSSSGPRSGMVSP